MRGLRLTLLGVSCAICHRRERKGHKLEPHHIDGKSHNNQAWNLAFAHKTCHLELSRLNQQFRNPRGSLAIERDARSKPRERENISTAGPPGAGWSDTPWANREGEKHEVMRERWNAWIIDKQDGPFHAEGMRVRKSDLAAMAPHALGLGSSVAYLRYIKEDQMGGVLSIFREDGLLWVELVKGESET